MRHVPLLTFLLVFQVRYEYYNNCNYTEVGEPFAERAYAVAVQQGSHLQEEISKVILELQKDRYFETLSSKYWNSTLRSLCPTLDDSEGEYYFTCSLQVLYVLILVNLFLPLSLHRSHLNEGCMHIYLKCNLVTIEIPNLFPYLVQKSIWDLKIDKITFQLGV